MSSPNPPGAEPEVVDALAEAVLAVDGVEALHQGMFGEVGSYLPGRRVPGIRVHENSTEVHVVVRWGSPVRGTADAIRRAAAEVRPGQVDVMIADVAMQSGSEQGRTPPEEKGEEETS
ncbi:hypothetical protein [Phytoactinopolyspora mesophila]|uniref:hypothetical protein n=1 Tax=Phytoactinopolyspora mesophila TaxID=2650750 RepID=UPI001C9E58E2|nr:hypothetical protein [Phytoactinopolyspora mesophila]